MAIEINISTTNDTTPPISGSVVVGAMQGGGGEVGPWFTHMTNKIYVARKLHRWMT